MEESRKKILVCYAYHESAEAARNLAFFQRFGMRRKEDVDYILVCNGPVKEGVSPAFEGWTAVLHRENFGFDFGAWRMALEIFAPFSLLPPRRGLPVEGKYDFFFFLNDTVRGPFASAFGEGEEMDWIGKMLPQLTASEKLGGLSINPYRQPCGGIMPHVQSMFFFTDRVGMGIISKVFRLPQRLKKDVIQVQEVGMSTEILRANFNITCAIPSLRHDYRLFTGYTAPPRRPIPPAWKSAIGARDVWFAGSYNYNAQRWPKSSETIFVKSNRANNPYEEESLKMENSIEISKVEPENLIPATKKESEMPTISPNSQTEISPEAQNPEISTIDPKSER